MDTIFGWFKSLGGWLVVTIGGLLAIGVLYLLGRTGTEIRKGVATKKALHKIRNEASQKGCGVNAKWHEIDRKATKSIWVPITGWALLYVVLFMVLPGRAFGFSLLALVVPALGFFGILFGVDADDLLG